jgi:hypothetical protein
VDLHPASGFDDGSVAVALDAHQQVGYGLFAESQSLMTHALVWSGTAASMIDLNPGPNYVSYARGVRDGQQVGAVIKYYPNGPGSDPPPYAMAAMWHGSADSWVDLHPAGYDYSTALATNGPEQVGMAYNLLFPFHAFLWHGTAASATDLGAFLPPGFDDPEALAIDRDGNIAGLAWRVVANHDAYAQMIVWTPQRSPGDVNLDGAVDFTDLLTLVQHYGQSGGWVDGDMNGDGTIGFDDLLAARPALRTGDPGNVRGERRRIGRDGVGARARRCFYVDRPHRREFSRRRYAQARGGLIVRWRRRASGSAARPASATHGSGTETNACSAWPTDTWPKCWAKVRRSVKSTVPSRLKSPVE